MEHGAKLKSLLLDIKNMKIIFYIPILIMIFCTIYILFIQNKYDEAKNIIRGNFGIFPVIGIVVWIIYLFEDLLDSDGKEVLLSMPYIYIDYGLFRVVKMTSLYVVIFYLFLSLTIFLFNSGYGFEAQDFYLPVLSVFFYSAFSFFLTVIIKNTIITIAVTGIFSTFMYATRGGVSAYIYPFQWANPNPYYSSGKVGFILIIAIIILYTSANIIFKNREYLMK